MRIALIDADLLLNASAWEVTELEEAKENYLGKLDNITAEVFATERACAVGGPDNFRETVFFDYKRSASRLASSSKRPDWWLDYKHWAGSREDSVLTDNLEADDLLGIWQTQLNGEGWLISGDKDLLMIPGNTYSRAGTKYLGWDKPFGKVSHKEAFRFLCWQLLCGDSTDFIPGLPGIGPVKANNILAERVSSVTVVDAYKEVYGLEWMDYLLSNGKLLYIKRRENENFSLGLLETLEEEVAKTHDYEQRPLEVAV